MKLLNFLLIKLTLCLLLGIVIGFATLVQYQTVLLIFGVCLALWGVTFLVQHFKVIQTVYLSIITYITFIVLGVLTVVFHTETNHGSHYVNHIPLNDEALIRIHVYKKLKASKYNNKFLAEVMTVNSLKTSGKLLINVDTLLHVAIDDMLYTKGVLMNYAPPKNPYQFDYGRYMKNQQVYKQMYVTSANTFKLTSKKTVFGYAETIRNKINSTLNKHNISDENLSIINALLLGQRQEVTKATYKSFINSGAVHILAISGLHIGLLLLVLRAFFKPITYLKHGKVIASLAIIFLLWIYAFITGFSPSVVRAVIMFSLITIAMYANRITNTYNVLTISAFLLLLYNPFYVHEIGFQLSYLAVFAIVWIKPVFDKFWTPKNYVLKKFFDVFSVSVAAQLGILPVALFYFHQFPGLFFITNLVIIPLLGFLLCLGLACLVFGYFGHIPSLMFEVFNGSISLLLQFVQFISSKEDFVFTNISFNRVSMLACYLLIISGVLLCKKFTYRRVVFLLIGVISVQAAVLYNSSVYGEKQAFIVFNQYNATLLGVKKGNEFVYAVKGEYSKLPVTTYLTNEFIKKIRQESLQNVYVFHDKRILIIDERAVCLGDFNPDLVLLTASPKVNLERLIRDIRPKQVIATTNNYKSYVDRWRETCASKSIVFYAISEKGAYVLEK